MKYCFSTTRGYHSKSFLFIYSYFYLFIFKIYLLPQEATIGRCVHFDGLEDYEAMSIRRLAYTFRNPYLRLGLPQADVRNRPIFHSAGRRLLLTDYRRMGASVRRPRRPGVENTGIDYMPGGRHLPFLLPLIIWCDYLTNFSIISV